MAPEQTTRQKYSRASDVWSYRVLLYEVFAAKKPWDELTNMAVAHAVIGGGRLQAPPRAPPIVAGVMTRCVNMEPTERLSMAAATIALDDDGNWSLTDVARVEEAVDKATLGARPRDALYDTFALGSAAAGAGAAAQEARTRRR